MAGIYLTDLEAVLRADNPRGFQILTIPGWQTRSNSHGGYEALRGCVIHHDAGGGSDAGSVNFQTFLDADRPNAALHVGRDGTVYIMAAGATNTQGLGGPIIGVPANRGNFQLIGIEQGNTGTGEIYPQRQQDAILWLCQTLVRVYGTRYGWGSGSVIAHFEWAPTRKIDPSGPSRWAPGGGKWNMAAFRADIPTVTPPPKPPVPLPPSVTLEDTDMPLLVWDDATGGALVVAADLSSKQFIHGEDWNALKVLPNYPLVNLEAETLSRIPQVGAATAQLAAINATLAALSLSLTPEQLAALAAEIGAAVPPPEINNAAVAKAVNDDAATRRAGWT